MILSIITQATVDMALCMVVACALVLSFALFVCGHSSGVHDDVLPWKRLWWLRWLQRLWWWWLHLRRAPSPTVPRPSPPPPCHRPLQAPRRVAPFPRCRISPHARLRYSSVASVCGRAGQLPPPRASEREGKEREIGVGMLTSGPAIFLEKNC